MVLIAGQVLKVKIRKYGGEGVSAVVIWRENMERKKIKKGISN
jgi:hypothetical protein